MHWASKSHRLPADIAGHRPHGKGGLGLQGAEKKEYSPAYCKAGAEHAQKLKYLRTDNELSAQRWLSGAGVCTFPLRDHLLEIRKHGGSSEAWDLGVMAIDWEEVWWPCTTSWTMHTGIL